MKVTINAEPADESSEKEEKYDKWQVDCAANDLIRAEEIKRDKKLYDLAIEKINEKKAAINAVPASLADLRKIAKAKSKED